MKNLNKILWGIVFISLGVLLALKAFNVLENDVLFDGWWTLIIIIPSVIGIITKREKTGSIICLCIGGLLLLVCRGIISLALLAKLIFPAIIVIIGLRMIFSSFFEGKTGDDIKKLKREIRDKRIGNATFGGYDMNVSDEIFEGAELSAVFGGVKCDLREAVIEKDCLINVSSIFGGIDIFVPDHVNVRSETTSVFGGVSVKKRNVKENSITLYVTGLCMFGGVNIK